ncbi:hypothetical protein ACTFIZ_007757 [Dictyostelium cf. discoideum]
MVESKKRVNQSLVKPKKPIKQIKLVKNTKISKNVKQPIIEEPESEQEQEELEKEEKLEEEEEDKEEEKITFNNNNNEEEEEEEEEEVEEEGDDDKDDFEIKNENVEIKSNGPKGKTNEQLLCERFIKTMAASYAQQLKGKNSTGSTLRGLYFESINQLKHEGIRELLFKPQSWHKFYRIVRAILKSKKDNDIEDIEIKETVEDDEDDDNDEDNDENNNNNNNNKSEDEEEEISNTIFKNLLSYQIISGRESLIQQLKDNQPEELQHLYKQSISLNQSDKYSIIINSFFITSKLSPCQLLHKFIMYSLTLNNVTNEIIDMLNTIIDLSDINDKESNSSIYKSLRQFLSISILDNLKNNNSIDNDASNIKSYVKLATNLFKFSLLNSSNSSIQFIESDYSAIKLLLGKSITFLPKLVSMMTSFDFSQDQFIQQQQQQQQSSNNKNNINNISIFLNQFIQESKLSNPPTNSISYLKSRILCERGILVLTKLKDPLLTKLKISSATLPVPESLLNFFKEKQGQSLLIKTHKSMDDTQAIRLLKLNNLLEILNKIEEIENKQQQQQQQQQDDNQENDYIEDHYTINKEGGNTNDENDGADEEIEEQIDSMEGTKSLLDFLDEDDLKSDDE